jgi:hypothetical protein
VSDQFCSGVSHLCLLPLTSPDGRRHCPACQRYSRTESALAFMCLGMEIGLPVTQNALGHLLGHVCDHGDDPKNPATRIYRTAERQLFHTDSCDVVRDASHIQCCSPVPRSCPCACVPRVLVARPWVLSCATVVPVCMCTTRSCGTTMGALLCHGRARVHVYHAFLWHDHGCFSDCGCGCWSCAPTRSHTLCHYPSTSSRVWVNTYPLTHSIYLPTRARARAHTHTHTHTHTHFTCAHPGGVALPSSCRTRWCISNLVVGRNT